MWEAALETVTRVGASKMVDDDMLRKIWDWMILRFALNTDRDWKVWMYVIGAAAHLEYLAVVILWESDGRRDAFESYLPRVTLAQAAAQIDQQKLIDPRIVQTLRDVANLRNSVAHKGATWGIPFPAGDLGQYKGRHIFTDPDELSQLVFDVDEATEAMAEWRKSRSH